MSSTMNKCYSELIKLPTFEDRFEYLKLSGIPFDETFGFDRYLNQKFYNSREWRSLRDYIITRDVGRDLGLEGYELYDGLLIHHINPITKADLVNHSSIVFDPENLITTCSRTHNAIHYGAKDQLAKEYVPRKPNDTCPWRW